MEVQCLSLRPDAWLWINSRYAGMTTTLIYRGYDSRSSTMRWPLM
jgi:hypothetical protein